MLVRSARIAQIFYYNTTDRTLRTQCASCRGQCMTATEPAPPGNVSLLAAQFARARFVQAIQARGTAVPIKFNGMAFTNQAGVNGVSDVDYRQWGPDHWCAGTVC